MASRRKIGVLFVFIALVVGFFGLFPGTFVQCGTCNWWDLVCQAGLPACLLQKSLVSLGLLIFGGLILLTGLYLVIRNE